MIIDGVQFQASPYEDGLWVTLMCPHKYITEKQLIVEDYMSQQQRTQQGLFEPLGDKIDEV